MAANASAGMILLYFRINFEINFLRVHMKVTLLKSVNISMNTAPVILSQVAVLKSHLAPGIALSACGHRGVIANSMHQSFV